MVDLELTEGYAELYLYNADFQLIQNKYDVGQDTYIDAVVAAGTYYIEVDLSGIEGGAYDLWWDDVVALQDDAYEDNNTHLTAYHPGFDWEDTRLSDGNGPGVLWDADWYQIEVSPEETRLVVDMEFDGFPDIALELYDADGTWVANSSYTHEHGHEHLDRVVAAGTYYLRVYDAYSVGPQYTGIVYDLWWDDLTLPAEDAYEENDTLRTAYYPGFDWENTRLSQLEGLGGQMDDDWYRIEVSPEEPRLLVKMEFKETAGNIDLAIHDADGDPAFRLQIDSVVTVEGVRLQVAAIVLQERGRPVTLVSRRVVEHRQWMERIAHVRPEPARMFFLSVACQSDGRNALAPLPPPAGCGF
jgi:hypothetical protein